MNLTKFSNSELMRLWVELRAEIRRRREINRKIRVEFHLGKAMRRVGVHYVIGGFSSRPHLPFRTRALKRAPVVLHSNHEGGFYLLLSKQELEVDAVLLEVRSGSAESIAVGKPRSDIIDVKNCVAVARYGDPVSKSVEPEFADRNAHPEWWAILWELLKGGYVG